MTTSTFDPSILTKIRDTYSTPTSLAGFPMGVQ